MQEPELVYSRHVGYPLAYEDALDVEALYRLRPSSEEKPAKKAKVVGAGGGIISRFLTSATGGYERRGGRLASVGF